MEIETLKEENETLRHTISDLEQQLAEAVASNDEFIESSKECEALMEDEISHKTQEIKLLQEQLGQEKAERGALQSRVKEGVNEISRLQAELQTLRDGMETLKVEKRRLESDNDAMENAGRQAEAQVEMLQQKLDEALER
jgi:chromosome segregation ATPase